MFAANLEIPIMHCFDNNFVIPAAVSFESMLAHADQTYFYKLYVLHNNITVQNQEKLSALVTKYENASLEFIDMRHQLNDVWNSSEMDRGHLRKEVLYKLLVPSLFPQYKKIIITDVDVVFLGDIAPSFFALDDHPKAYYAGVRHINPEGTYLRDYYNNNYKARLDSEEFSKLKICGGYLVANLELLRQDNMEAVMIDYLTNNYTKLPQLEQDVINFCCRDSQVVYLPLEYIVCSYMYDLCTDLTVCASDAYYTFREMQDAMMHPIQLHYATEKKPWKYPDSTKAEVWFNELSKIPFQADYYNQRNARAEIGTAPDYPCADKRIAANTVFQKKVSVLCCTYNHERFIEAALEGILKQKTNFSYEIIVADDASSDHTPEIITRFQEQYPDKLTKVILRSKNVGIGENYFNALSLVEGEFLAICDGDDCWIDENKLQMQVDFLESHPQHTVLCTDFVSHYVNDDARPDSRFHVYDYIGKRKANYTLKDLIFCRFIGSCTMMLRWQLKGRIPEFIRHYQVIDFPLALIHASMGYIGVLENCTAQYNVHDLGISSKVHTDIANQYDTMIYEVNEFFNHRLTKYQDEYYRYLHHASDSTDTQPLQSTTVRKPFLLRALKKVYKVVLPLSLRNAIHRLISK